MLVLVEYTCTEFLGERDRDTKTSENDRVDKDLPVEVNAAHVVLVCTVGLRHNRLETK